MTSVLRHAALLPLARRGYWPWPSTPVVRLQHAFFWSSSTVKPARKATAALNTLTALRPTTSTNKSVGDVLEARVAAALRRRGYTVRRNVQVRDRHGNRSEIDVIGESTFRTVYVECKNWAAPVPIDSVAKFKAVLELNDLPLRQGLFIATSGYGPRATRLGVKTLDGAQFAEWEAASHRIGWMRAAARVFLLTGGIAVGALVLLSPAGVRLPTGMDVARTPRHLSGSELAGSAAGGIPVESDAWRRLNGLYARLTQGVGLVRGYLGLDGLTSAVATAVAAVAATSSRSTNGNTEVGGADGRHD